MLGHLGDYPLHSYTKKLEWFRILTVIDEWKTERQSISCQDVGVDDACRDAKHAEVVLRFGLIEVNAKTVKFDKHTNFWLDDSSFHKKQYSPLFARSGEETW